MTRGCLVFAILLLFASKHSASAEITSEDELDAYLPREATLNSLKSKIDSDPENQANYFSYVQIATALGRMDHVAWAYDQLLAVNPSLDRVRLDLSVVYVALGRFDDARTLLNHVLAKHPPEAVQENIKTLLSKIDQATTRHSLNASLSVGMASDSNANTAPSSGNVLVLDTAVPLDPDAQEQSDLHGFTALTLGHGYSLSQSNSHGFYWQTHGITYLTRHDDLYNLNLQLYGLRTGPEWLYKPWGTKFSLLAGYNYLILDAQSYLRSPSIEVGADFPITSQLRGFLKSQAEYREFLNSDVITTYDDRSGTAWQTQLGLRFISSERSLWDLTATLRRENTSRDYYANHQFNFAIGNTYGFSPDILYGILADSFISGRAGYKMSRYDGADLLISDKRRADNESNVQIMAGHKFPHDIVLSIGYSYTNTISNLENYRYDNHHYTVSLTKSFDYGIRH